MKVQQTSLLAYIELKNLSEKRAQVYRAIEIGGSLCNQQIAGILRWEINRVTPRTNELVKAGLVIMDRKALYKPTGRIVIFWKTV
jgi:DNA-binding MarR family transcriptional regulator